MTNGSRYSVRLPEGEFLAKRPWRSHYTRDWATDPFVRGLGLEARMVYLELLDITWDEGGLQPEWLETGRYLAQRIGVGRAKFLRIFALLSDKFQKNSDGILVNFRLESERLLSESYSEKQRNRAKSRYAAPAAALPITTQSLHYTTQQNRSEEAQKILSLVPDVSEAFDFEAVYHAYPKHIGVTKGRERFRKQITSRADYDAIVKSVANYQALVSSEGRETKYIKAFDVFMNCWRDFVDYKPESEGPRKYANFSEPRAAVKETKDVDL